MIEDHLTNLELSKKLEELGEPQVSEFYWIKPSSAQKAFVVDKENLGKRDIDTLEYVYSAFLASELGEKLPLYLKEDADKGISFSVEVSGLHIWKTYDGKGWAVAYGSRTVSADTLPNALAKMRIYLKENNLLKI